MTDLKAALAETADKVEAVLDDVLSPAGAPETRIYDAMRYTSLGGGKRLRPFLVAQSSVLFDVEEMNALRTGAALELIHCYSLVHDDLPAMDDDDLRRGKPTVHKAYDEATAVLVGDALLTLAFEVVAQPETHTDAEIRVELIDMLARASGVRGMVGGQMIDLEAEKKELDLAEITQLQQLKTGALIGFGCEAGAILGRADKGQRTALIDYASDLGLAFQIADDLLDVEGSVEETGKAVGKDEDAGKETFVSILGVDGARDEAKRIAERAVSHLDCFDAKADLLRATAEFVVVRRN
ncbi:MAG: farnesyl-diphosphate synthase [Rhodospirillaceae bacterium]|nr:farnesyl-diphosphate synthase [Rhodospirillaceae bacterium]HAA92283.1 farnesyl-diphosphate synthase [Rhodospirillaceae bacterium]